MKFQMLGDANKAGPVRLSDVYDSEVGGASTGIAASQKALYDAYNSLNSRITYRVIGSVQGQTIVTVDSSIYQEICVFAYKNYYAVCSGYFPTYYLLAGRIIDFGGYDATGVASQLRIQCPSDNSIKLDYYCFNGARSSSSDISVNVVGKLKKT